MYVIIDIEAKNKYSIESSVFPKMLMTVVLKVTKIWTCITKSTEEEKVTGKFRTLQLVTIPATMDALLLLLFLNKLK